MDIFIGIVMCVCILFGGMTFIAGVGSIGDAYNGKADGREVAGMVTTGAVLLAIAFTSAAYLGKQDQKARAIIAAYNRVHCTVKVEGVAYHPDHVRTYRGTGTMVFEDGSVVTFLGGTIQGCR